MTLDDAILRKMEEAVRNERPHAAFFDWPDREVAELGVAKAFSEAAVHEPGLPFQRLEADDAWRSRSRSWSTATRL